MPPPAHRAFARLGDTGPWVELAPGALAPRRRVPPAHRPAGTCERPGTGRRLARRAAVPNLLSARTATTSVSDVAFEIASQMDLPQVRAVAVRRAAELCEADGATLFLRDASTGELCFEVVEGPGAGTLRRLRLGKGEGLAGRAALEGAPVLCEAVEQSSDHARRLDGAGGFHAGSIAAVPVKFGAEVLGVLEVVRARGRTPLGAQHVALLVSLAPHVAAALKHAHSEQALRASREALERYNRELEARVQERTALLSRGKREWESTFDAISDPIAVIEGFVVRRANRQFARTSGRAWTELIGARCHEVLAGRPTPCAGCPLVTGVGADVALGEATFQVSTYAMTLGEDRPAHVMHYRDVTEQRALSRQLQEAERLAAVGQLASGAAHEINNPLALLHANLDAVREGLAELTLPPRLEGLPAVVDESLGGARRIAEVVKSLRQLARQESGTPEPTSLNRAAERAVKRVVGDRHQVTLCLEARAAVLAPPAQLELAISHLVKNAEQALAGEGLLSVKTFDDGDTVVLEVEDSGCGIPAEHLAHVFEPFFTTRRVGEGQGLGLAVTYGIVTRAGGEVSLRSTPGEGTTVTARLPAASSARAQRPRELAAGRYAELGSASQSGLYRGADSSKQKLKA